VPVTAKLSKRFYDTFGEQIANELVDWFNKVDETYRTDLRELNELNFARFDAKLEQRFAEFDAKWGTRWTELDAKWGGRWTELDAKLEQRIAELRAELRTETAALRKDLESAFARAEARVEQRLAQVKSDLVKWMFAFWAPTALATVGTALGVVSLLLRR
jgi:hypothetical protein